MRDDLLIGLLYAAVGALMTALAAQYAGPQFWEVIEWGAVALILGCVASLWLSHSHRTTGRPFLGPALSINLGICLVVAGFVWHFSFDSQHSSAQKATFPEQPSLVTLFMTDFVMKFTGAITNWQTAVKIPEKDFQTEIFLNLCYDYNTNTKFVVAFVPNSPFVREISIYIRDHIDDFFQRDKAEMNFGLRGQGETNINRIGDMQFSGRVFLYYPGAVTIEELADVVKIFREKNDSVQVRGDDYAIGVWTNFRTGLAPPPKQFFQIRGNEIVPVTN
jgi:hypothetical protein